MCVLREKVDIKVEIKKEIEESKQVNEENSPTSMWQISPERKMGTLRLNAVKET